MLPPSTPSNREPWPPDYIAARAWRRGQIAKFEMDPSLALHAKAFYRQHPVEFINHWCDTLDPRKAASNEPTRMPFILFPRQVDFVHFIMACLDGQAPGLVEKSRDMGATWVSSAVSVWLWLFWDGVAVGWGSRKKELVDRIGDPASIFEKLRTLITGLPDVFLPKGLSERDHLTYMRCVNPENGSTIVGEIGDDIGRGARTLAYFVDEAAHLDHPEMVEASLLDTTRTRIDMSSVSGLGTIFHRKREAGREWEPGDKAIKTETNVFILDWSDHPGKSLAWYDQEKKRLSDYGMAHIFAREVDRDYAAAAAGVIIPSDWVKAAIDADKKLGFDDSGGNVGALDVADSDGRGDRNAGSRRKGVCLKDVQEWAKRDTAVTTRTAIAMVSGFGPVDLMYDCIGVGSGVKAEYNRLRDDGLIPDGIRLIPWNAGAGVIDPHERVIPEDKQSPKNKDFYHNLKAQAWWALRRRFEKVWRAVSKEEGFTWEPDELISIPSDLPNLRQLMKELSQATMGHSTKMKLLINKAPEGTRSPNLADSVVMNYFPLIGQRSARVSLAAPIIVR